MPDRLLIGGLVFRPYRAFGDIGHREFPVLRRLIEPVEKPLALLLPRHIEEELQDHGAVAGEVTLEGGNILEPLAPDVPGHQPRRDLLLGEDFRMHPHHQAFLVIGAIENADAAALRQRDRAPPHEVVVEFMGRRLLERGDFAALRIDAVKDAFYGAVLAGRVHALKDQKQRPAILCVKLLLKIAQPIAVGVEDLFALGLVETALLVGLVRLEMEFAGSIDTKRRNERPQQGAKRWHGLFAHEAGHSGSYAGEGIWPAGAAPYLFVIASEAKQSIRQQESKNGLLRFARNDGLG